MKRRLIEEAGGKCANPGCSNWRVHIHHIQPWAIYQTHDAEHMIAVCPSCHDAVEHGPLEINDDTVYRWKRIERTGPPRDHLYVEPGPPPKLLLGSLAVQGDEGLIVFELGASTRLSFRVADGDIMLVNLAVSTVSGEELLRIVDGHVRLAASEPVVHERRPGRLRVAAPPAPEHVPPWTLEQLRVQEPDYGAGGQIPLLDIEVLEPGLARVQGVWAAPDHAVVITEQRFAFTTPGSREPVSLIGEGVDSVLHWAGPVTEALFGFADDARHALRGKVGRNAPCPCGSGRKYKKCHGA